MPQGDRRCFVLLEVAAAITRIHEEAPPAPISATASFSRPVDHMPVAAGREICAGGMDSKILLIVAELQDCLSSGRASQASVWTTSS
jgi:hypothetical protein